jgi:hypothetical protein
MTAFTIEFITQDNVKRFLAERKQEENKYKLNKSGFKGDFYSLERQDRNRESFQPQMPLCKLVKAMRFNQEMQNRFLEQFG